MHRRSKRLQEVEPLQMIRLNQLVPYSDLERYFGEPGPFEYQMLMTDNGLKSPIEVMPLRNNAGLH
jgi:hypothetical protein